MFNWGQETAMIARNSKERHPHTPKTSCHHAMKGSTDRLRILKISGEKKKRQRMVPFGTLKSINTHYRCSKPRTPPVNPTLLSQPPCSMSHHTRPHLACLLFLTVWKNHNKTILQLPCSTSARSDIYPVTTTSLLHSVVTFFSPSSIRTLQNSNRTPREVLKRNLTIAFAARMISSQLLALVMQNELQEKI